MKNLFLCALVLSLLGACAGAPSKDSSKLRTIKEYEEAVRNNEFEMLPAPFTVEEIYAAMPVGKTSVVRSQGAGQPTLIATAVVTQSTSQMGTFSSVSHDTNGNLIETHEPFMGSWKQMRDQASFPVHLTTMRQESRTGPLGTHTYKVYTVQSPITANQTTVVWFAEEFPGPPILIETYQDGEMTKSSEIIELK